MYAIYLIDFLPAARMNVSTLQPQQARPGNNASGLCLSVYWSSDICMERQMDEQTGENTVEIRYNGPEGTGEFWFLKW